MSSATGRRLRPRFRELETAGLIVGAKRSGVVKYRTTPTGRQLLKDAGAVTLPESLRHRRWREARETATKRIGGFRAEVGALLGEAAAALAKDGTNSEAWLAFSERLERACWRLGSAAHCLREWPEPSDDTADVDADALRGWRDLTRWRS